MLKKGLENKFFLKLLITNCLIMLSGLGITAYFLTSSTINHLVETQSNYEKEIVLKVKADVEEKFKTVNRLFTQLYTPGYYTPSVANLLSPYKDINYSDDERKSFLINTMQNMCNSNSFITDMMLVGYATDEVYFYSKETYREFNLNNDFMASGFMKIIKKGINQRGFLTNYIPDYINYFGKKPYPVITLYINLYDNDYFNVNHSIGAVAFNINPEIFSAQYQGELVNLKGDILISDDNGYVILDSSNKLTTQISPYEQQSKAKANNKNLIINSYDSEYTGLTFVNVVKKEVIYQELKSVVDHAWNIIIICVILTILVSIFASRIFSKRIIRLVKHFRKLEKGSFDTRIHVQSHDEVGYLEQSFNNMCEKLDHYVKSVYLSEIKTKTFELKSLQAQINPHFLFNTLESIRMLALMNQDKQTAKMIHILGGMIRWNIKMSDMIVRFSDEIEYLNAYLELQQVRYQNRFQIEMQMDIGISELYIPKMLLQPIIENAIHHGIGSKAEGEGMITIKAWESGPNTLEIQIIDNGIGMDAVQINEVTARLQVTEDSDLHSIGLRNVYQRIILLFGEPYGLHISSISGHGTVVSVSLPIMTTKELDLHV